MAVKNEKIAMHWIFCLSMNDCIGHAGLNNFSPDEQTLSIQKTLWEILIVGSSTIVQHKMQCPLRNAQYKKRWEKNMI